MATTRILYIGTYTKRRAQARLANATASHAHGGGGAPGGGPIGGGAPCGILVCEYNPENGAITPRSAAGDTDNPSWVTTHPVLPVLYAVSEAGRPEGGAIHCYARAPEAGDLSFMGEVPSGGRGPCYVSVSNDGRFAFAANYNSGTVSSYRVVADGMLLGPVSTIQHNGSSVNEARQAAAHAHQAYPDTSGRFLLVPDLGTDRVEVYEIDRETGALDKSRLSISIEPGSGPRHVAFYPDGSFLYLVNELSSTVAVISWPVTREAPRRPDAATTAGRAGHKGPAVIQTISTLPDDFGGAGTTAAIRLHPSGCFVYASNRGHDSVAIYRVGGDHRLESIGWASTRGRTPREVNLSPDGRFLFAANQDSNAIVTFAIDQSSGLLSFVRSTEATRPVCLHFA